MNILTGGNFGLGVRQTSHLFLVDAKPLSSLMNVHAPQVHTPSCPPVTELEDNFAIDSGIAFLLTVKESKDAEFSTGGRLVACKDGATSNASSGFFAKNVSFV